MINVILLTNIINLGKLGDEVTIKNGYARNFLIPFKKAIVANKENIKYFKSYKAEIELKLNKIKKLEIEKFNKIKKLESISIYAKAGKSKKLFGSVSIKDIVKTINLYGIKVNKKNIHLPNGKLHVLGKHNINIKINSELVTKFYVNVLNKKT
ncbi:MAG: 50S ribosomal protein L9 [Enterobacterales bacterium]